MSDAENKNVLVLCSVAHKQLRPNSLIKKEEIKAAQ